MRKASRAVALSTALVVLTAAAVLVNAQAKTV